MVMGMSLEGQLCGNTNGRRFYNCLECTSLMRSSKRANDGMLCVAADAKKLDFVWNFVSIFVVAHGYQPLRRTQVKQHLKAFKRAHGHGYIDVLERCVGCDVCAPHGRTQGHNRRSEVVGDRFSRGASTSHCRYMACRAANKQGSQSGFSSPTQREADTLAHTSGTTQM